MTCEHINKYAKSMCQPCYMKRYYSDPYRKKMRSARVMEHYSKMRTIIDSIKDVPCCDCGNKFPPCAMDFDHVRGEKRFNIGQHIAGHSLDSILSEIEKCDIVCANCHRIRTHGCQDAG